MIVNETDRHTPVSAAFVSLSKPRAVWCFSRWFVEYRLQLTSFPCFVDVRKASAEGDESACRARLAGLTSGRFRVRAAHLSCSSELCLFNPHHGAGLLDSDAAFDRGRSTLQVKRAISAKPGLNLKTQ